MDLFIHYNICTKTKCNKQGHIEKDCRKKQFDLKRKGKKSYPQIHSASIQNDNVNYSEEDEENNFIQAFTIDANESQENQRKAMTTFCFSTLGRHIT